MMSLRGSITSNYKPWLLSQEMFAPCANKVWFELDQVCVCVCVGEVFLTWTPAQVFDVDLLLLHAGRLPDQTGVVVGVAVGGAHRVLVVAAAVDVTYTPVRVGRERGSRAPAVKTGSGKPARAARRSATPTTRPPSLRRTLRRICRCCTW